MAQLQPQTPLSDRAAIDRLADRYTFRDADDVAAHLAAHPRLIPVLEEVARVVPRYFGTDAPLALAVFVDPEDDEEHQELTAYVKTTMLPREAWERLSQFDEQWWLNVSPSPPDTLVIMLEFR